MGQKECQLRIPLLPSVLSQMKKKHLSPFTLQGKRPLFITGNSSNCLGDSFCFFWNLLVFCDLENILINVGCN